MPDFLLDIDKALFQVLNGHLVSAPTDFLFPILTSIHIIWPVYLLLAFYLIYTHRAKGIYALFSLTMMAAIFMGSERLFRASKQTDEGGRV